MPEFVNRSWGWFRARPTIQKVLIILGALVVLAAVSRVVAGIAGLVFVLAVIGLVVQLIRRRPVRMWTIVAVGALVVSLVFGGLASAIFGPTAQDQAKAPQVEKPRPEKQRSEKPKPPSAQKASEKQASESEPKQAKEDAKKLEGPPEYSVEDVTIDKGGGPGSAAALQVIAPDVERGEQAARLAAVDYAQHDYVMMDLYASKSKLAAKESYAMATVAFSERGAKWTGLTIGEMRYDRNK